MLKENVSTSHRDVMPAVAKMVGEVTFEGYLPTLPDEMQEICELFLETEQANDRVIREKMLRCLHTIRKLSQTMAPFTSAQVYEACKEQGYE